jgi:hypothetical protein
MASPQVVAQYPRKNGEDTNSTGICPAALGTKDQQPATYSPKTGLFYADEPRLHGLRALQGELHGRPALCRRDGCDIRPRVKKIWATLHCLGHGEGRDRVVEARAVLRYGRARWRPAAMSCSTARSKATSRQSIRTAANSYQFKTTVRHHRQHQHLRTWRRVRCGPVRRWWLGCAIGLAGGLLAPENAAAWHGAVGRPRRRATATAVGTAGLGAVGGYAALADYRPGGQLTVFGLPD